MWSGSQYVGTCSPCGNGYQSVAGEERCQRVACPANSKNHPRCECVSNYAGNIRWDAQSGKYQGSCEPCREGFASKEGSSVCDVVPCPARSLNHPRCTCGVGYEGAIEWNAAIRTYSGSCVACRAGLASSGSDDRCAAVACPAHSSRSAGGSDRCVCDAGYQGVVVWGESAGYVGECLPCPRGTTSHNGVCISVACPENAVFHPECVCRNGFNGTVSWNSKTLRYDGECRRCAAGEREQNDRCVAVGCNIHGSLGSPCRCMDGWFGAVSWNEYESGWRGECRPCAPGYSSAESTRAVDGSAIVTSCERVACPANAEKHPYCSCAHGFGGLITWNGLEYEGECVPVTSESPRPSTSPTARPSVSLSSSITPSISTTPSYSAVPSPTPCAEMVFVDDEEALGLYRPCEKGPGAGGATTQFCHGEWAISWFSGGALNAAEWRLENGIKALYRAKGSDRMSLPHADWLTVDTTSSATDNNTTSNTSNSRRAPLRMSCVTSTTPGCCVFFRYDETLSPSSFDYVEEELPERCLVTAASAYSKRASEHFPMMPCAVAQQRILSRKAMAEPSLAPKPSPSPERGDVPVLRAGQLQRVVLSAIVQTTVGVDEFVRNGELMSVAVEAMADAADLPSSHVNVLSVQSMDRAGTTYLNITVQVATRTQDVTDRLLLIVRFPTRLDQLVQRLCREYHCRTGLAIRDIVGDRVEVIDASNDGGSGGGSASQQQVVIECKRYSGRSVDLCTSHSGCSCVAERPVSGFTLCDVCQGEHVAGGRPSSTAGYRGDESEPPLVTSREERTMLGRWRAAHSVEKRNAIRVSSDEEVMVPRPPRVGGAKDAVQGEEDEAVMVPRKLYAAQDDAPTLERPKTVPLADMNKANL